MAVSGFKTLTASEDLGDKVVSSFFLTATGGNDFKTEIPVIVGKYYSFTVTSRSGGTFDANYYKADGSYTNTLFNLTSLVQYEPKTVIVQIPVGFLGLYVSSYNPFSGVLKVSEYTETATAPISFSFDPSVNATTRIGTGGYNAGSDVLHTGSAFAITTNQTWGANIYYHPTDGSTDYVATTGNTNLWTFPAACCASSPAAGIAMYAGYSNATETNRVWFIGYGAEPNTRWSEQTPPTRFETMSVSDTSGLFFAYENSTQTAIYTGGPYGWTLRSKPSSKAWTRVASSPTTHIALCPSSGTAYQNLKFTSTNNGVSWSETTDMPSSPFGTGDFWFDITYGVDSNGVGRFVAISYQGAFATSIDEGVSWYVNGVQNNTQWRHVTYGNGIFIMERTGQTTYYTSTNGVNWTQRYNGNGNFGTERPAFGNNVFFFRDGSSSFVLHTQKTKKLVI